MRHANSSACLVVAPQLHPLEESQNNSEAIHRKGEPEPNADYSVLLYFILVEVYNSKNWRKVEGTFLQFQLSSDFVSEDNLVSRI
jgi:hypothetical protein